jgi:hypothetical protein
VVGLLPWAGSGQIVAAVEAALELGEIARHALLADGMEGAGQTALRYRPSGAWSEAEQGVGPPEGGVLTAILPEPVTIGRSSRTWARWRPNDCPRMALDPACSLRAVPASPYTPSAKSAARRAIWSKTLPQQPPLRSCRHKRPFGPGFLPDSAQACRAFKQAVAC